MLLKLKINKYWKHKFCAKFKRLPHNWRLFKRKKRAARKRQTNETKEDFHILYQDNLTAEEPL